MATVNNWVEINRLRVAGAIVEGAIAKQTPEIVSNNVYAINSVTGAKERFEKLKTYIVGRFVV